jgi:hypothetical protein
MRKCYHKDVRDCRRGWEQGLGGASKVVVVEKAAASFESLTALSNSPTLPSKAFIVSCASILLVNFAIAVICAISCITCSTISSFVTPFTLVGEDGEVTG